MHSYPAWKVWLVAIVLLVAALFALPNLYGDAPALQLSRNDRAAMAEADLGSVTTALAAKNIPIEASYLAEDRLVLRFHTVEQQLVGTRRAAGVHRARTTWSRCRRCRARRAGCAPSG